MRELGHDMVEGNSWLNMDFRRYTVLPKASGRLTSEAWRWWEKRSKGDV